MKKNISRLFMLGVVATGLMFSSCNKNNGKDLTPESKSQNMIISVDLGGNGLRAAMSELQDKVADGAAADAKTIDVYFVDASKKIVKGERFDKTADQAKFDALVNTAAEKNIEKDKTNGNGYKFYDVDNSVKQVAIVINSSSAKLDDGKQIDSEEVLQKLSAGATTAGVVYAQMKPVVQKGVEPWGVDQDNKAKAGDVVKVAQFNIHGSMNRYQLTPKFSTINAKMNEAGDKTMKEAWYDAYFKEHESEAKGSTEADKQAYLKSKADEAFVDGTTTVTVDTKTIKGIPAGEGYTSGKGSRDNWDNFYEVVDITSKVDAAFMNRYNNAYNPFADTTAEPLYSKTATGSLDLDNGTWSPFNSETSKTQDATDNTLYYKKDAGFDTTDKVFAFNFFTKGITNYDNQATTGEFANSPKLHFHIKTGTTGVRDEHSFVNIVGVKEPSKTIEKGDGAGNQLINIDLTKLNEFNGEGNPGDGIIVDPDDPTVNDDPDVTTGGDPDIGKTNYNLIILANVKPWVAVDVKPIVE